MIYWVELMERKVLGEVVNRKEGVREEMTRERKTCGRKFLLGCASLGVPVHNTYHCDVGGYSYVVALLCWVARWDCGRGSGCLFYYCFLGHE